MTAPLKAVVLSSESMGVVVVPDLGGRVVEMADFSSGRQWLWRNHRLPLGPVAADSAYDDVWQGGFEELFPNDAVTNMPGRTRYPDHGELWQHAWKVEEAAPTSVTLSTIGQATGVKVQKTFTVHGSELRVSYRLTNDEVEPLPHLFKLHPAFHVDSNCRIDLPGGFVEKVDPTFGNLVDGVERFSWPRVDDTDLSVCRDQSSGFYDFVYVSDLPEGWCGLSDLSCRSRLRIDYPRDVFPYCWLFITYGGWRQHNVVVLEPCTNYPKDLPTAIANGTAAVLAPRSVTEFEVGFRVEPMT